jgi:hypothetical protein
MCVPVRNVPGRRQGTPAMISLLLALAALHENTVSSSRVEVSGREVRVFFSFTLEDLKGLGRLDLDRDGVVSREEWEKILPPLLSYFGDHFQVESGGKRCVPLPEIRRVPPAMPLVEGRTPVPLEIRYRAEKDISDLKVRCTLFFEHSGNPRHVAELPDGLVLVFDRDRSDSESIVASRRTMVVQWIGLGAALVLAGGSGFAARRRLEWLRPILFGAPRTGAETRPL